MRFGVRHFNAALARAIYCPIHNPAMNRRNQSGDESPHSKCRTDGTGRRTGLKNSRNSIGKNSRESLSSQRAGYFGYVINPDNTGGFWIKKRNCIRRVHGPYRSYESPESQTRSYGDFFNPIVPRFVIFASSEQDNVFIVEVE